MLELDLQLEQMSLALVDSPRNESGPIHMVSLLLEDGVTGWADSCWRYIYVYFFINVNYIMRLP